MEFEKTDKKVKLLDKDMESVSGGYNAGRMEGFSSGQWVQCPFCGAVQRENIKHTTDSSRGLDIFTCICGGKWGMDENGYIYKDVSGGSVSRGNVVFYRQ